MQGKLKGRIIILILLSMLMQLLMPIFSTVVLASDETTETEEITRDYEIKEEETWDVSEAQDGSVMAKWTLEDKTIVISGTGEMKALNNEKYSKLIEKVIIEDGVTSIGVYAFTGCISLESIEIPSSVASIGDYAFSECSSLLSIEIPSSVTRIKSNAFSGCSSLGNITVDKNNKNYTGEDGILFSKDKKEILKFPEGKKDFNEYNIPNTVTSIGGYAFFKCSLENIEIPSSVTSIGSNVFEKCSSLESIKIPNNVTSIENKTFYGCSSLENIEIPNSVISIGSYAFSGCSNLTSIKIPISVTSISEYAIDKTTIIYAKADSEGHRYSEEGEQGYILDGVANNLTTNYEIKEEETWDISSNNDGSVIAKWKLEDRSIVIYGTEEMKNWKRDYIGDWHNTQYTSLVEKVIVETGLTTIKGIAFRGCSRLKNITIPEGVISIGYNAFEGCSSLVNITIPNSVTTIKGEAFRGCSSLTNITIPEGVTEIEYNMFTECSRLANIEIPSGLTNIGPYAFYKCSSLKSLTIPEGVTSIGGYALDGCNKLENIIVNDNNKNYTDENGILFSKDKKDIIVYPKGKSDLIYSIPKGVTDIKNDAFSGCSGLEIIEIPSTVTSIGTYAFRNCRNLKTLIIPDNVTTIKLKSIDESTIIYCKSNTEAHRYAEEGEQSYIIDDDVPEVTFKINGNSNPSKQQETIVTVTDKEVGVKEDSLKYIWTQSIKEPTQEEFINTFNNGESIKKSNGDGQWYLWVLAKDKLENTRIVRSEVFVFDNTAPICKVTHNTTESTNKNVTVTIRANEEMQKIEGWNLSNDKLTLTKEYTGNTTEEIIVKDLLGNKSKVNIIINNIDKQSPTAGVSYNITPLTNQNVIATITANEQMQEIQGWTLSKDKLTLTKEYSKNTTEEVIVKDIAGNETKVNVKISNIDKYFSEVEVSYNITELTNKDVIVTITANEEIQEVNGWTRTADKKSLQRTFTQNTREQTLIVKDLAGNQRTVTFEVKNIDKIAARVTVNYSTTEEIYGPVTVTINADEEIQEIDGWTRSLDKKTLEKTFSRNTTQTITVKDLAGNTTNASIEINNIKHKQNIKDDVYEITEDNYILGIQPNTQMETCLNNLGVTVDNTNSGIVKTGDKITVDGITYTLIVVGDITKDGQFDIQDLSNLCYHIANLKELKGEALKASDMNKDKIVDMIDLSRMCMRLANLD